MLPIAPENGAFYRNAPRCTPPCHRRLRAVRKVGRRFRDPVVPRLGLRQACQRTAPRRLTGGIWQADGFAALLVGARAKQCRCAFSRGQPGAACGSNRSRESGVWHAASVRRRAKPRRVWSCRSTGRSKKCSASSTNAAPTLPPPSHPTRAAGSTRRQATPCPAGNTCAP